jgi:multimeric flavodoxin WrbA
MVDEFLGGACDCGARVESIQLVSKVVRPCTGCFECFSDKSGRCPIRDDMSWLIQKFIGSDIVVLATPIYMDNVTGLMKNFIDRLLPLLDAHFEIDEKGEYRHCKRHKKMPEIVAIANAHMPEQSQFQVVRIFMQRLARSLHTKLIAEIYRPTGGILGSREEDFKPYIKAYKQILREAGHDLILSGYVSMHIREQLEKPLVPTELYIEYANRMWDKLSVPHQHSPFAKIHSFISTLWA